MVGATGTELKYRIDTGSFDHLADKELRRNEISLVNVATAEPIVFDPYDENRHTDGFTLIDRYSHPTSTIIMVPSDSRRFLIVNGRQFGTDAVGPPQTDER